MTRLLVVALLAILATACGGGDHGSHSASGGDDGATRTVRIIMKDIAFTPASVKVSKGETVRFVFRNDGKLAHDAFVGDEAAQADHEEEMRIGDGDHGHGEEAVTVEPGDTAELEHTFTDAGSVLIGCHQVGHYDAGMKVTVTVA